MTSAADLTSEEKRRALDLILQSRTFHRAEQLKAFLRFVCETEMEGRADHLTEYLIGVTVMGRPEGYSPAEDSCVRTRAYELRQKLEKFYSLEAPEAPWQIVLPKGSYVPQYVPRRSKLTHQKAVAAEPAEPARRGPLGAWIAGLIIAAMAGGAVTYLLSSQTAAAPKPSPVLTEAWGPFASPDANAFSTANAVDGIVFDSFGNPVQYHVLKAHPGGDIWVKTSPNQGSTFSFALPIIEFTDENGLEHEPVSLENYSESKA